MQPGKERQKGNNNNAKLMLAPLCSPPRGKGTTDLLDRKSNVQIQKQQNANVMSGWKLTSVNQKSLSNCKGANSAGLPSTSSALWGCAVWSIHVAWQHMQNNGQCM